MNTIEELKNEVLNCPELFETFTQQAKVNELIDSAVQITEQRIIGVIKGKQDAYRQLIMSGSTKNKSHWRGCLTVCQDLIELLATPAQELKQQIRGASTPAPEKEYCEWVLAPDGNYDNCKNIVVSKKRKEIFDMAHCFSCGKPIKIREEKQRIQGDSGKLS
jgi:hypothetical protein